MANGIELATAWVSIVPSTQGLRKEIAAEMRGVEADAGRTGRNAGKKMGGGMSGAMVGVGKKIFAPLAAAAATVSIGSFFSDAIKGASDLQQSVGGVNTVFGKQAAAINAASAAASKNLGLSKNQYNELATTMGAMLKNQGFKDFGDQTQILIKRGADLAATFGGTTKESVEALSAALRGEYDPLERYGITLNESMINAELAAKGQDKLKGAALEQAKAQARVALIMKQSAAAQGQFAREADTFAGKQARLAASWENFKAIVGSALLPAMSALLDVLSAVGGAMGDLFARAGGGEGVMARLKAGFDAVAQSPVGRWFAEFAQQVAAKVWPALQGIGQTITGDVLPSFAAFGQALVNSPIIRGLLAIFGPVVLGMIDGLVRVVRGAVNIIGGALKVLAGILTLDFGKAWEGLVQIAKGALEGIIGLLQVGFLGRIGAVLKGAGVILGAAFKGIFGTAFKTIITSVSEMGLTVGQILGRLFVAAVKAAGVALTAFLATSQTVWNAVSGAVSTAWGAISRVFTSLTSWLGGRLATGWGQFRDAVVTAWSGASSAVSAAWSYLSGVFTQVAAWLGGRLAAGWAQFRSAAATAWSAVSAAVSAAWSVMSPIFTFLGNVLTKMLAGAWNAYKTAATVALALVVIGVQGMWNAAKGIFNLLAAALQATLVPAFKAFQTAATVAWSTVSTAVTNAWARMSGVFSTLVAWVTGQLTAGWRTLQAAAQTAWSAITNAVAAAWARLLAIFTPLRTWAATTLTGAWNLLRSSAATAWAGITSAVSASWARLVAIFTPLRTWAVSTLTSAWATLRSATSTAWSGITTAVSNAYSRLVSWFTPLRTWATSTLTGAFNTLRSVMSSVWSGITTTISNAWSRINTSFTSLKNGVNSVWSFFQSAQRGIADVWSRLTGSVQGPINATRSWINSNLVSKMNSALGGIGVSLRVPALAQGGLWLGPGVTKAAGGSVLPGYTPGRDVHRFWSPTGGRLDLSGGEAIMVPEWVRALGPALIRQMNAIARRGGVGAIRRFLFGDGSRGSGAGDTPYLGRTAFASGGIWRPRSFAGGGILDTLKGVGGAVLDFFGNPFGAFVGLGKAILGDLPNNAGFAWGMARGFIPKVAEGVANKAKNLLASMFGGTGPVGNGTASGNVMGWQNQWNWLRNAVPGVRLNSAYRPGAITATGNRSYHSRGRAIDVTPSMAVFNRIKSAWGSRIAELIYSPANGGQVWHGRPHMYTGITRAMHFNHVHWAMKHGGVFGGVKLFDQGGLLRRGDVAVHQGMKPDRVLTDAQWKAVMRHLPVQQPGYQGWQAVQAGGVHVHGDVYGDPERFARRVTTRMRDELGLLQLAGVS